MSFDSTLGASKKKVSAFHGVWYKMHAADIQN